MPQPSPPPPSPFQLSETWDAVAPSYAAEIVPLVTSYAVEATRIVPVAPSSQVLDVAAGPGTLTFIAAAVAARVVAVDFAPGMIEQVRQRAATTGARNVEAAVMDAQTLSFGDSTFDTAFCLFGLQFVPDRARALREIRRVLRPSGRVLIATWGPLARRPFMRVGFDALTDVLPDTLPTPNVCLESTEACIAEVTTAGFEQVAARPFTASIRVESAEHYVRLMELSGAPFAALRKKLGEDAWIATRQRFEEAVQRRLGNGGADLAAEAIMTSGTRG